MPTTRPAELVTFDTGAPRFVRVRVPAESGLARNPTQEGRDADVDAEIQRIREKYELGKRRAKTIAPNRRPLIDSQAVVAQPHDHPDVDWEHMPDVDKKQPHPHTDTTRDDGSDPLHITVPGHDDGTSAPGAESNKDRLGHWAKDVIGRLPWFLAGVAWGNVTHDAIVAIAETHVGMGARQVLDPALTFVAVGVAALKERIPIMNRAVEGHPGRKDFINGNALGNILGTLEFIYLKDQMDGLVNFLKGVGGGANQGGGQVGPTSGLEGSASGNVGLGGPLVGPETLVAPPGQGLIVIADKLGVGTNVGDLGDVQGVHNLLQDPHNLKNVIDTFTAHHFPAGVDAARGIADKGFDLHDPHVKTWVENLRLAVQLNSTWVKP